MPPPSPFTRASETEVRLVSPAKVNLALSVGPPRPDGYHLIASWMVAVAFGDDVTIRRGDAGDSRFDIAFADDAPQPQPIDWPLEKDLGYRARRRLEAEVGRDLPVDVRLRKRVPAGAGLGGGSGNAAAVLVGVNQLYGLGMETTRLVMIGSALGCDVAFLVAALAGRPSALATGLGEQLEDAPVPRPIHLVLLLPPLTCPTGGVYRQFDASPTGDANPNRVREAIALGGRDDLLFNDLAEPAMGVTPQLRHIRDQIATNLGRRVHVTGSGAAMFLIASDADEATRLATQATASTGIPAVATRTLGTV